MSPNLNLNLRRIGLQHSLSLEGRAWHQPRLKILESVLTDGNVIGNNRHNILAILAI